MSTGNPAHESLDLTAEAAGATDVEVRWRYYDADFEWTWFVDNVRVDFTAPGGCNMTPCAGPAGPPPPIPDGSGPSQPMRADRDAPDGSRILVQWDDGCAPVSTKILWGPLDQVGGLGVSGSVCDIANPESWDPAPAGDIWFVLVSDDGSGAESSWGLATGDERNGTTASGTCGSTVKDLTGSCP